MFRPYGVPVRQQYFGDFSFFLIDAPDFAAHSLAAGGAKSVR